jgi:hypothetical protein
MSNPIKRHHPGGSLSLIKFRNLVFVAGTTAGR